MYDVLEHHLYYKQYKGEAGYEELIKKLNSRIGEILVSAKSRHTHELHEHELQQEEIEEQTFEELETIHEELHEDDVEEIVEV